MTQRLQILRLTLLTLAFAAWGAHAQYAPKPISTKAVAKGATKAETPPPGPVEKSVLRIGCSGDSDKVDVAINGEVKGRCPFDAEVPIGDVRVTAIRKVSAGREQTFQDELQLGSGVVQRVEVVLSRAHLTDEAYQRKKAVEPDALKWEAEQRLALPALVAAAEGGDPASMYRLGQFHRWGSGGVVDIDKSMVWITRAAQAGHPAAMSAFAWALNSGQGVVQNEALAFDWYRKAASAGDGRAMAAIGRAFLLGDNGYEKNLELARQWWRKGIEAGDPDALMSMGTNPGADHFGSAPESLLLKQKSLAVYMSRWRAGDLDAAVSMATFYRYAASFGAPRDDLVAITLEAVAVRYRTKGADSGDALALVWLAQDYALGEYGLDVDEALAESLYRKAIAKGSPRAAKDLEWLLKKKG
jgi:TPR repeat protein